MLLNLLMELQSQLTTRVISPDKYLSIFWLIQNQLIALLTLVETLFGIALFNHQIQATRAFLLCFICLLQLLQFDLLLREDFCVYVYLML